MSYDSSDLKTTRAAFAATADNSALYASGVVENMNYLASQKLAAGDVYDPTINKGKKPSKAQVVYSPSPWVKPGNIDLGSGDTTTAPVKPKRPKGVDVSL